MWFSIWDDFYNPGDCNPHIWTFHKPSIWTQPYKATWLLMFSPQDGELLLTVTELYRDLQGSKGLEKKLLVALNIQYMLFFVDVCTYNKIYDYIYVYVNILMNISSCLWIDVSLPC